MELTGVNLEIKKTHLLRRLKWELARGIYQDLSSSTTWDELVAKAKRHKTMHIKESQVCDLQQGKYQVLTPSNYYTNLAPLRQERESQYIPIYIDLAEIEADIICIWFKKLTPKEQNQLAKKGKCFYCKNPSVMVRNGFTPKYNQGFLFFRMYLVFIWLLF